MTMKELSIEEKAKRFDEILKMAKECITYIPDEAVNKYMLSMFPELAESEDERIRKEIVRFIQMEVEDEMVGNKWLAWLEKQGKQNPSCIQITITQNIIDYINQNKAKFELDIPKLGDIWNIKEIHTYPGNPIVELENSEGAWLNLPLHVVFDNLMTI